MGRHAESRRSDSGSGVVVNYVASLSANPRSGWLGRVSLADCRARLNSTISESEKARGRQPRRP